MIIVIILLLFIGQSKIFYAKISITLKWPKITRETGD